MNQALALLTIATDAYEADPSAVPAIVEELYRAGVRVYVDEWVTIRLNDWSQALDVQTWTEMARIVRNNGKHRGERRWAQPHAELGSNPQGLDWCVGVLETGDVLSGCIMNARRMAGDPEPERLERSITFVDTNIEMRMGYGYSIMDHRFPWFIDPV